MNIIDSHVHIYPPEVEKTWEKIAKGEPWFDSLVRSKVHRWGTSEALIENMDKYGIKSAFATGFAFIDQGLCRMMNDYVLETARRYPGRVFPLAVVSPLRAGAEQEISRCAEAGAIGVGELFPDGQNMDISDIGQTWRITGTCCERGLFIMFHTAEQAGHEYPGKGSTGADKAAAFCKNHPEVRVVFSHFGGGLWAYEAMPEMKLTLANAYYDTAAWPWLYDHKIIEAVFAIGAGHKTLFGSDWPILDFARYEKFLTQTTLSEEQKTAFLYGNALTLLMNRR